MGRQRRRQTLGKHDCGRLVNLIRRGDIFLVNLDPVRSNEAKGTRPAVVVTGNAANMESTTIVIVPLTSNTERIYPFQVLVPLERSGLNENSKAQVEQIRSISVTRMIRRIGQIPNDLMQDLNDKIRMHLDLE
jgi:mRNA interferase MazF